MNGYPPPGSKFIPVEDPKEIRDFLKEAVAALSQTLIWTKEQKQMIKTHLSRVNLSEKLLYAHIPKGANPELLKSSLAKADTNECFLSLQLPKATLFFKLPFLGYDEEGMRFGFPEKIFRVQRRLHLRFKTPAGFVYKVEYTLPEVRSRPFSRQILDISAGGLAFLVPADDKDHFRAGQALLRMTFAVKEHPFICDAEVRHVKAMPAFSEHRGVKIGVLFKDLSEAETAWISDYVMEAHRLYFTGMS